MCVVPVLCLVYFRLLCCKSVRDLWCFGCVELWGVLPFVCLIGGLSLNTLFSSVYGMCVVPVLCFICCV